jgi:aldehyde:ferredoxin oxidoreductase
MPDGPAKGVVCHLDEMLEQYYQIRGWSQDGLPTDEKLKDVGLDGM